MMQGGPMMIMMGGPGGGPAATGPRFVWNRGLTVSSFYTYGQNFDNTDGAFVIPASIFLADEWGPSAFDRRHNMHVAAHQHGAPQLQCPSRILGLVRAAPDDSHRDRRQRRPGLQRPPAGVGRNSERTTSTWNTSASFGYSFTLGKKTVTSGGGVQIMGSPAGLTVNPTASQTTPRYRLNLSVNINNLWNQASYSGYSGIITSPNFLKPSPRQAGAGSRLPRT